MFNGELEVELKSGEVKRLKAGDALAEVVNTLHKGNNVGAIPVKLVVFCVGRRSKNLLNSVTGYVDH